ncbi:trans-aconitate 2-methyltransferase [Marimonas sp. MJW-29]|uniref:Trans-aconitate 2-methyltransferase n=1 Tax=Sulfitobacter sediminis TaxID=3234186 RepID=A0ABV3RKY4_9RHOB
MQDRGKDHWDTVYSEKSQSQLSWHQDDPTASVKLCTLAGITPATSVIDIGGGRSPLAAQLVDKGLKDITVLDISRVALEKAREAMGGNAARITWTVADITRWTPTRTYDIWHDRAVFHFLTVTADQEAYLARMKRALGSGGHAIIATFAPDGPETCSGLPVMRYSPDSLSERLGPGYTRLADRAIRHETPWGSAQSFQFSLFRRLA